MILSDRDIEKRIDAGDLVIDPIDDRSMQIQPASVDLRLGSKFLQFKNTRFPCIHPDREQEINDYVSETKFREVEDAHIPLDNFERHENEEVVGHDQEFILHPDDFVLGTTKETVEIPDDLLAHVEGRSSLGRLAIVVHATAGIVDPGYRGQITLELSNLGKAPVALKPGMRISQLTFTQLSSPAARPYGKERGSKYQDQVGPQASRLQQDVEFGGRQIKKERDQTPESSKK